MTDAAINPALLSIALDLLLLFAVVGLVFFGRSLRWTRENAPFVPVSKHVLADIVRTLEVKPESIVYDLGSGDGRVLLAAHRAEPRAAYTGVELSAFPFLLSRIRAKLAGARGLTFVQQDFHATNIARATHLFLYLTTSVLEQLYPKLERELAPGTRVITCDFEFPQKQPVEIIPVAKNRLNSNLYVYIF